LVPEQGEAKQQPGGILAYFEGLLRGCNAAMGRKDFFEMGSRRYRWLHRTDRYAVFLLQFQFPYKSKADRGDDHKKTSKDSRTFHLSEAHDSTAFAFLHVAAD